jgi:asparagine synthase (glutamine-hydrolysing)
VGEGSDELGGYPGYRGIHREYRVLRHFAGAPRWIKDAIYRSSPLKVRRRLGIAMEGSVSSRRHVHAFTEEEKKGIWVGAETESSYSLLSGIMEEVTTGTEDEFLRRVSNVEFKLRLPELILPRVDRPTMANSVEARVPFLDHGLVELMLRLPFASKMKNGEAKYFQKKLLSERLKPEHVYREKVGFGMLLEPFLKNVLPGWFDDTILGRREHPLFNYLDRDRVAGMLEAGVGGKGSGLRTWAVYALAKWLEQHC